MPHKPGYGDPFRPGSIMLELDELQAENERLREALTAILNEFDPGENDPVVRIATDALNAR